MTEYHPSRFLVLSGGVRRGEVVMRRAGLRDRLGTQEREQAADGHDAGPDVAIVEWLDAEGAVLAAAHLPVHSGCGFPTGSTATFSGALDHHPGAASIRVSAQQGAPVVLDAARAPSGIRWRIHPEPGEVLGTSVDLAWELDPYDVEDDPRPAEVSAWLRLGPGDKSPVVPVPLHRADPAATEGVLDLTGYGARTGCSLELWVSRVGSVATTVVSAGPYSTAPQAPTLLIRSPLEGAFVPAGIPVTCDALVLSDEAESLRDLPVRWSSSVQGPLDDGSPVSVVLVSGPHELTATYGVGELAAQASVRVEVTAY